MAKRFLSIVLCMMLVAPASILRADETEIPLIETLTIGYLGGDEPLDDPGHTGMEPPIMRFRATHSLNTLSIISLEAVGTATVAVLDKYSLPMDSTLQIEVLDTYGSSQDVVITDTIDVTTITVMGVYNGWYNAANAYMYTLYLHPNISDAFPVIQLVLGSPDNMGINDGRIRYAVYWESATESVDAVGYRGGISYVETTNYQDFLVNIYDISLDIIFGTTMYQISYRDMIPFYTSKQEYYFLYHDAGMTSLDVTEDFSGSSNNQMFNLLGQPVDETYHGIVIQNGQKRVQ